MRGINRFLLLAISPIFPCILLIRQQESVNHDLLGLWRTSSRRPDGTYGFTVTLEKPSALVDELTG